MKLIKIIYDNAPRILAAVFVMFAGIYMFFTYGIFFGVLTALVYVAAHYIPKRMMKKCRVGCERTHV